MPAVVPTRHGNTNSNNCNWRNGRVGYPGTGSKDELWKQLNHGQVVTSADEYEANPQNFWGWNDTPENVWERVYDEPALAQAQNAALLAEVARRGR